jgi:SAM-dependent methyltransferase
MQNQRWGDGWVQAQDLIDRGLKPFETLLTEQVRPGATVLDVGCGTGATTLAAAGKAARVVGVDISPAMIDAARARTDAAEFLVADAQRHAFAPETFDQVISRFGVMFFDDPVAAFANLRAATKRGGTLHAIVWRTLEENPFHTVAEEAARPLLPDLPRRDNRQPGQFALGDERRVREILDAAGWSDVALAPTDVPLTLPTSRLESYFTLFGPVAIALKEVDETTRAKVVEAVRPAFAPYVDGPAVRFDAACWTVSAARP